METQEEKDRLENILLILQKANDSEWIGSAAALLDVELVMKAFKTQEEEVDKTLEE